MGVEMDDDASNYVWNVSTVYKVVGAWFAVLGWLIVLGSLAYVGQQSGSTLLQVVTFSSYLLVVVFVFLVSRDGLEVLVGHGRKGPAGSGPC